MFYSGENDIDRLANIYRKMKSQSLHEARGGGMYNLVKKNIQKGVRFGNKINSGKANISLSDHSNSMQVIIGQYKNKILMTDADINNICTAMAHYLGNIEAVTDRRNPGSVINQVEWGYRKIFKENDVWGRDRVSETITWDLIEIQREMPKTTRNDTYDTIAEYFVNMLDEISFTLGMWAAMTDLMNSE